MVGRYTIRIRSPGTSVSRERVRWLIQETRGLRRKHAAAALPTLADTIKEYSGLVYEYFSHLDIFEIRPMADALCHVVDDRWLLPFCSASPAVFRIILDVKSRVASPAAQLLIWEVDYQGSSTDLRILGVYRFSIPNDTYFSCGELRTEAKKLVSLDLT